MRMFINVKLLTITLLLFTTMLVKAQVITNVKAVLKRDIIEITYDLESRMPEEQTFDLLLFGSHNGYASPLLLVSGDIGEELQPGPGKKIIWRAREELGDTQGEIILEVGGIPTPPFVRIFQPQTGDKIRRGKTLDVQWQSETGGQVILTLEKDGKAITTTAPIPNNGSYRWQLDPKLAKGKGYRLVFTNAANKAKTVKSELFTVQPKMGAGLKILPFIVIGGVAAILFSGAQDAETPTQGIPVPIKPGN